MNWNRQIQQVITGKRQFALLHGDCMDLSRRIQAGVVHTTICDPPYGMSYMGKNNKRPAIANDQRPFIWWLNDAYRLMKTNAALACFCQWKGQQDFKTAIRLAGFDVRSHTIWDRLNGGMGHTSCTFAPRHDIIWFATKGKFRFPNGRPDSVLPFPNVAPSKRFHSTQKPHDLMTRLVDVLTPRRGIVFDPCMGSGSTGVAAIAAGRRFIGIELDPTNYETACQRMQTRGRMKAKIMPPMHCHYMHRMIA